MNLFQIINSLELSEKIQSKLTQADIIGIEKRVKAEVKMDGLIKTGEANSFIAALKDFLPEVQFVLANKDLYDLILFKDDLTTDPGSQVQNNNVDFERVKLFIHTYCRDSIVQCCQMNIKWKTFEVFTTVYKFMEYMPDDIPESITNALHEKLRKIIYSLRTNKMNGEEAHLMPFFFWTLDIFKNFETDELIEELLNGSILFYGEKIKGKTKRLVHAMSYYEPIDSNLKEVIRENTEILEDSEEASFAGIPWRILALVAYVIFKLMQCT